MNKGEKNRRFGETDVNERSSRSHTILRIVSLIKDIKVYKHLKKLVYFLIMQVQTKVLSLSYMYCILYLSIKM